MPSLCSSAWTSWLCRNSAWPRQYRGLDLRQLKRHHESLHPRETFRLRLPTHIEAQLRAEQSSELGRAAMRTPLVIGRDEGVSQGAQLQVLRPAHAALLVAAAHVERHIVGYHLRVHRLGFAECSKQGREPLGACAPCSTVHPLGPACLRHHGRRCTTPSHLGDTHPTLNLEGCGAFVLLMASKQQQTP